MYTPRQSGPGCMGSWAHGVPGVSRSGRGTTSVHAVISSGQQFQTVYILGFLVVLSESGAGPRLGVELFRIPFYFGESILARCGSHHRCSDWQSGFLKHLSLPAGLSCRICCCCSRIKSQPLRGKEVQEGVRGACDLSVKFLARSRRAAKTLAG